VTSSSDVSAPSVLSTPDILDGVARIRASGRSEPFPARDPVNLPMINNWVEAIGDMNPVYVDDAAARAAGHPGAVGPPAMMQVWTMYGLHGHRPADDPLSLAMALMDEAGFTAVVATNCDQAHHRYVQHGEQLSMTTELGDVSGPKRTRLGTGWFISTIHRWYSSGEEVARMSFRIFKYRPESSGGDPARSERAGTQTPSATAAAGPLAGGAGHDLPPMRIEASPTFIVASALATRDFQDVHHDRDRAIGHGAKDIFLNIITDTALAQRFATDWAGPAARVREISIRLGVPCYAYDSLLFTGRAVTVGPAQTVSLAGRGQLGDHVVGTVRLAAR
jgi:N-terminal half of MaoC dehydratase